MDTSYRFEIDRKLDYINMRGKLALSYGADNENVLRGVDYEGRILYIKQFNSQDELFQFLCGICHVLEEL